MSFSKPITVERRGQQPQHTGASAENNYGLPPYLAVDNEQMKELARCYIIKELKKRGHQKIANGLRPIKNAESETHRLVEAIAAEFERERLKQFKDMFAGMEINKDNLQITYDTVIGEIFKDGVHWGKITAYLVFSSHLAVYCAEHSMEQRVKDVVSWSEREMQTRIHDWVQEQGGWSQFVPHIHSDWSVSLSSAVLATGVIITVIAGGIFAVKKMLF